MLNRLKNFFVQNEDKIDNKVLSWKDEKHDLALIQRNALFLLLILFIILSLAGVFVILYITQNTQVKPFIIQINGDTGKATLIKEKNDIISQNDSLAQFFIKQYLNARETYNAADFTTLALTKIKLFSTYDVYNQFLGYISNPTFNPTLLYGTANSTYLIIKSWSKVSNNSYIVRFSINESAGELRQFHKISVLQFEYVSKEFSKQDLEINPVGFTITSYRVDSDES